MKPKKNKSDRKIGNGILQMLVKLGVSNNAGRCYETLIQSGGLTSDELAKKMSVLPNAIYRLTRDLEKRGLIVHLDTYPIKFQAVPPESALNLIANAQIKEIEHAKNVAIESLQSKTNNPQTKIEILTGWEKMMEKYVALAKEARNEILIISQGEQVTDEVRLTNRDALEKNINIKFIIHQYGDSNYELIRSWVKMGIQTRYFSESGYHLVVVDGKKCILSSSNPDSPQERSSVVIYGEGLARAMQQYFYVLWNKAKDIDIN